MLFYCLVDCLNIAVRNNRLPILFDASSGELKTLSGFRHQKVSADGKSKRTLKKEGRPVNTTEKEKPLLVVITGRTDKIMFL